MKTTEVGNVGEQIAALHLQKSGHTILFTNFRNRNGEIDIISISEEVLYCTEVKNWSNSLHFHPLCVFNETKKKRMKKLYYYLIKKHPALVHLTVSFSLAHINEKREVHFYSHLF
jgi:putative endonuclease